MSKAWKLLKLLLILLTFFKFKLFVIKIGLISFLGINRPANGLVEFESSKDLRLSKYATWALFQISIPSVLSLLLIHFKFLIKGI